MSEDDQKTKRIFCNICGGMTNQILRASYCCPRTRLDEFEDLPPELEGTCEYRHFIWSCAGCDYVTFEWQISYTPDSEDFADQEYYPERQGERQAAEDRRIFPKSFRNLHPKLSKLYCEIVHCFNGDCMVLCTVGLRALIEEICDDKGIEKKQAFEKRIGELRRFLPSENVIQALQDLRLAGNGAAHEREPMTQDEAEEAIDILQDILNSLYELDYKATQTKRAKERAALKSAKLDSRSIQ